MSRKDKSLEEIDIVKLLLFLLLFIAICMVMIFAFIIPSIKEYKIEKADYRSQYMTTSRIENILKSKEKELKTLSIENRKILNAFANSFDEERFIKYASSFFNSVSLIKASKEEPQKGEFVLYELNVSSSLDTPKKFYEFLEGLNRYDSIVKADFPIEMQAKDSEIKAKFNIKVYELNSSK